MISLGKIGIKHAEWNEVQLPNFQTVSAVILEQIQTSYKIMPQMAETKLALSGTEYYEQIKNLLQI